MDLKTFNTLFGEYRLASLEASDGGSLQRKLDAELAVLEAANELSERRTAIPSVIDYNLLAAVKEMLHYYAPGAQESAEHNGEDSLHSAVRHARRAVREAEVAQPVTTEDILAAVDTEELHGDMPEDIWMSIQRMDRTQMAGFLRGVVRDTKEVIRTRLQTLLNHG